VRDRQQLGQQLQHFRIGRDGVLVEGHDLGQLRRDRLALRAEARRVLDALDDRVEGAVGVIGRALIAQDRAVLPIDHALELAHQPGLADARLTLDQATLPAPLLDGLPALHQALQFGHTADE
jgi:hypothetical protein